MALFFFLAVDARLCSRFFFGVAGLGTVELLRGFGRGIIAVGGIKVYIFVSS